MVIILPQSGQLQNYLKGDLAELQNYLWARVESKLLKKKKKKKTCRETYMHGRQEIGPSFPLTDLLVRLSRFHPSLFLSSYAFLLSCGKDATCSSKLA